jgi:hypothetical protein
MEGNRLKKTIAVNPYLPGYEYEPDGEPYVFGDRVYVYGSHDLSYGTKFCQGDYVCWSAPIDDLGDWRYEGIIYEKTQDPGNKEGLHEMYAPDVEIGPDGRYYLYYALEGVKRMSVAVCNEPAGKYEFYGYVHYKNEDGTETLLTKDSPDDPAVFKDDDGRIYVYYGFCLPISPDDIPKEGKEQQKDRPAIPPVNLEMMLQNKKGAMVVELERDMLTIKGMPKTIVPNKMNSLGTGFEGHAFFEASSMRKINNTYYFIYSSIQTHELCYAVSKYPDKDFRYGGTIVSNGDIGLKGREAQDNVYPIGNNHGSIVNIKGKWYIFYHRQTQGTAFSRQGCAEEIQILADGSIPQVEITSCGLNGGSLEAKSTYSAHICCNLRSKYGAGLRQYQIDRNQVAYVYEEVTGPQETDRNQYVANILDGTQIGFKYFSFDGTQKEIEAGIRGNAEGTLTVYTDGAATEVMTGEVGTVVATLPVNLSEQKDWSSISGKFADIQGTHSLFFVFSGKGNLEFNNFTIK